MILLHQNTADVSSLCFHSIASCNKSQDMLQSKRKGGRVVDGTGLENRQVNSFAGSNPVPSAIIKIRPSGSYFYNVWVVRSFWFENRRRRVKSRACSSFSEVTPDLLILRIQNQNLVTSHSSVIMR